MSRLTNLTTLRIGKYQSWSSYWHETDQVYSKLIFNDIYLYEYLNGIFYKLRMATALPTIREIGDGQLLISTNAFVYSRKSKLPYLFKEIQHFHAFGKKYALLTNLALYNKYERMQLQYRNQQVKKKHGIREKFLKHYETRRKGIYNKYSQKAISRFVWSYKQRRRHIKNTSSHTRVDKLLGRVFALKIKKKQIRIKTLMRAAIFEKTRRRMLKSAATLRNKLSSVFTNKAKTSGKFKKSSAKLFRIWKTYKKNCKTGLIKNKTLSSLGKVSSFKVKGYRSWGQLTNSRQVPLIFFSWLWAKLLRWYACCFIRVITLRNLLTNNTNKKNIYVKSLINYQKKTLFLSSVISCFPQRLSIKHSTTYWQPSNNTLSLPGFKRTIAWQRYRRVRWFKRYYHMRLLMHLHSKMEQSISEYLNKPIHLTVRYKKRKTPELLDAKQIGDFIRFQLEDGKPVMRALKLLLRIQNKEKANKIRLLVNLRKYAMNCIEKAEHYMTASRVVNNQWYGHFKSWEIDLQRLYKKKFPLQGIRIECNGPTKKGMMSKLMMYHLMVNDYKLPGKMPNQTVLADVRYWQSYARTKRAGIGIKVWVYLHSPLYNANKKYISI